MNEHAGESIHVRTQENEINGLRRKTLKKKKRAIEGPAYGTRFGVQKADKIAEENEKSKVEKLSRDQTAAMNSLYGTASKKWKLESYQKPPNAPGTKSVSRPALKDPCPPNRVVVHARNTEYSREAHLQSLRRLRKKAFPGSSHDRLLRAAARNAVADTSHAPWETRQ